MIKYYDLYKQMLEKYRIFKYKIIHIKYIV